MAYPVPVANVALRLPPGVVGIDVDAYKGEDATKAWAALLDRLGPLPLAPWCSARDDGLSGIRLFRVPPGYAPSDRGLGSAGEVIWHGHRYVVAPPSVHPDPGQVYRWVYPNKRKGGPQALLAANLPELPVGWLEALRAHLRAPDTAAIGWTNPDIPQLMANGIPLGVIQNEVLRDVAFALAMQGRSEEEAWAVWQAIVAKTIPTRAAEPWTEVDFRRHRDSALRRLAERTQAEVATEVRRLTVREQARQVLAAQAVQSVTFNPVDWQAAWTGHLDEPDWLSEPVIERGQTVSLWAAPATGKSLLALEIAAALASGRAALGNLPREPATVLYLDCENRQQKLIGRLRAMGHSPDEQGRLKLLSFPALAKLDTPQGGAQLAKLVDACQPALMVIDTMSRVIAGDENDARTFHRLLQPHDRAAAPGWDRAPAARPPRQRHQQGHARLLRQTRARRRRVGTGQRRAGHLPAEAGQGPRRAGRGAAEPEATHRAAAARVDGRGHESAADGGGAGPAGGPDRHQQARSRAWNAYTDLKKKTPSPSPGVVARTVRVELSKRDDANSGSPQITDVVVTEVIKAAEDAS